MKSFQIRLSSAVLGLSAALFALDASAAKSRLCTVNNGPYLSVGEEPDLICNTSTNDPVFNKANNQIFLDVQYQSFLVNDAVSNSERFEGKLRVEIYSKFTTQTAYTLLWQKDQPTNTTWGSQRIQGHLAKSNSNRQVTAKLAILKGIIHSQIYIQGTQCSSFDCAPHYSP